MKRFTMLLSVLFAAAGLVMTHATGAFSATIIKIAGMKPEGEPETIVMHRFGDFLFVNVNRDFHSFCPLLIL